MSNLKAVEIENKEVYSKHKLTAKQRAFISWYIASGVNMNGVEAARKAGYKGNYNTLKQIASENLSKPYIKEALDNKLMTLFTEADLTAEKVLRDLENCRKAAISEGKYAAAIRASELQGRWLGMW